MTKEESSTPKDGTEKGNLVWNEPNPMASGVAALWKKTFVKVLVWGTVLVLGVSVLVQQKPGPKVQVVTPQKRDVVELVIATGRVRSKETSTLSAEIAGVVETVFVDEGARVKRGQKLAKLVQSELSHMIRQARLSMETAQRLYLQASQKPLPADIAVARANVALAVSRYKQFSRDLKRGKRLFRSKSISQAELDKLLAGTEQARANVQVARANVQKLLSYPRAVDVGVVKARLFEAKAALRRLMSQASKRVIKAPFSGIIVSKRLALGQVVGAGTPLFVLASTERIEIFAETDESNLPKLKVGQTAIIVPSAYKKRSFQAVLQQIGPVVDSQRGVVGLRLRPLKLPSFALLNMTVDINVEVARWKDATSIPADTLVKRDGKHYVMALEGRQTRLIPIKLRGRNSDWLVCEGLPLQTRVIRRAHSMKAGKRVRIVKEKRRR
jgi:HlyD family secretion protein